MYQTKPELIGIYNNGIKSGGGGGGGGAGTEPVSITIKAANLTTPGVVITGNTSNPNLTSADVNIVPTLWWLQREIARLDSRIDDISGDGPTLTLVYNNTSPNLQMDTITASTDADATIQYLADGSATWETYTGPIDVYSNGTWIFKATNTSGASTQKTIVYENFVTGQPTPPPPSNEDEED